MADEKDGVTMLQARVNSVLMERFTRERDRWGMTNQEMIERILTQSLPVWESLPGPPTHTLK